MEYQKPVCNMKPGDSVEGFYILKSAQSKTSVSGKPFLNAALSDRTGSIDAKVWDYSGPIGPADEGRIIKIRGTVSEYRGTLQVTIDRLRLPEATDTYDKAALVPCAPIDTEKTLDEIRGLVDSLEDPDYAAVCRIMLQRHEAALAAIPAAKSVHHGFLGGLLMHTCGMLQLADFLAAQHSDIVDRSLLLTGTLLHDFAKEREFDFSEVGLVSGYSTEGQLLGHLVLGAQEVARVAEEAGIPAEKSILLQHMILSHHGEPEFGAAVRPMCAEAELLSYVDLIDSRMEIYRENLAELPAGTFSGRIFALEKRIYHHK